MRYLWLILIVPSFLLAGCRDDSKVNGWDVDHFAPHRASAFTPTPDGHLRDSGPFASVAAGFVTEDEISAAVDAGFRRFQALFPELPTPGPCVHLTEDYVFWYGGTWAGGASEHGNILICLYSRGTSTVDPGAEFIKRPPDSNYPWWRYTAEPLCPAIPHELLHCVIGDPNHTSAYWSQVD